VLGTYMLLSLAKTLILSSAAMFLWMGAVFISNFFLIM
jgi:hypothetical protein